MRAIAMTLRGPRLSSRSREKWNCVRGPARYPSDGLSRRAGAQYVSTETENGNGKNKGKYKMGRL